MSFIVAIDGPAGTGKGTATSLIAQKLNFISIDTGATYRCVTLAILNKNIKLNEVDKIKELLENINIEIQQGKEKQMFYLDGTNVTDIIRTKRITDFVSQVSAIKEVRYKMVDLQRKLAEDKNVIMEGRDIGTYVFPKAQVKIYLDASLEERARRRFKQNEEKGINISYEAVTENIRKRDYLDMNKEMGALKKADDAILIDTTNLKIEEVVDRIIEIIKQKTY